MTRDTDYFKTFCKISKAFRNGQHQTGVARPGRQQRHRHHGGQGGLPVSAGPETGVFVPVAQQGLSDTYFTPIP
jgi:hypothetical protein